MQIKDKFIYLITTIVTLLFLVMVFDFCKINRQSFLIKEVKSRNELIQVIKNEFGKFQFVDVDSFLINDYSWDEVVVLNEDLVRHKNKYGLIDSDNNGIIIGNSKIFLRKNKNWWITDVFLRKMKSIKLCDSILKYHTVKGSKIAFFKYRNKTGLLNGETGDKILNANYREIIEDFNYNLILKGIDNKYGLFDLSGKVIISSIYDTISVLSDKVYLVNLQKEKYLFKDGIKKISCVDCDINKIENHFYIENTEYYQLLNSSLDYVSPALESFSFLSKGYFSFSVGGSVGILKLNEMGGREIIPALYRKVNTIKDDYWLVEDFFGQKGLYLLEKTIVPTQFSNIEITENYIFVSKNGKMGLWDAHEQNEWIPAKYVEIEILNDNLIKVNDGFGKGILKKSDYFFSLIDCNYSDIILKEDYFQLVRNGKIGIANLSGTEILRPVFSKIERNSDDDLGIYYVASQNNWNYLVGVNGNLIIPEEYNFIEIQGGNLALVKDFFGLYGWYNLQTNSLQIECKYNKVENGFSYKQDIVRVFEGNKSYKIDYYGQIREGSSTLNKISNGIDDAVEAVENFFKK